MPTFISLLGVFVGSGMGGMLRYGIGLVAIRYGGLTFPWGTLVINIVGSALIGLVVGLFAARIIANAELRPFFSKRQIFVEVFHRILDPGSTLRER